MIDLGRLEEALRASHEAAALFRELVPSNPGLRLYLAMSLDTQGSILNGPGRREEALAATREAMQLRQPLAQA